MDMDLREIAAVALDEWNCGTVQSMSPSDAEDAFGIKFPKLGGGSNAPSVNPPKPAEAPKGPKKMGASESAQAQAMAGKSQAEQAQDLQSHDAIYHKKKPYDPETSTCTLRQKLVETQKAIGAPISEEQAKQMRISKKDLDAGNQSGSEKLGAAKKGNEDADPALVEIRDMRKRAQSMKGEDRAKADAEIQAKCVEFAKKNLGETQGEAVEGLFNKIKVAGKDMAQKIKDAFEKRDESTMTDAQKEVKEAIVEKADETLGVESSENPEKTEQPVDETSDPENQNTEVNPDESDGSVNAENQNEGQKVTLHKNQPAGSPDDQQVQALSDAIAEVDPEQYNEELSDHDKDVRRTEIANRAARYLEDWRDLDDPDKRAAAVEEAINDIERAKADGTKIQAAENEVFQSDVNPPPEKRWTEEGLNNRIKEIDDELLKDGADTDKLFDERESLSKKLKDGDFDAPSKADYRAKMLKAMKDKKSAEANLQAAKDAESAAKTKDEKEAAADAVAKAQEALEKSDDALKEARWELDNYEEPQEQDPQKTGETVSGSGDTGAYEGQIDGKTYVDLDKIEKEQGFAASLSAAFKAGYEGKDFVTKFDKMTGRWDKVAGAARNEQQKKDVDSLSQAMASAKVLRELKKKAALEKDPEMKEIYEQCVAMAETAKTAADIKKVFDHANKNRESLRKGKNADALNQARVEKEQANTANIKGREESRVAEEKRRDEKLQMARDKEEDRKRHQKFQEDMAKAKDVYKRAQDAKKELPDTAAKMNPDVVNAITDAMNSCKDPVKRGELKQVLINLEGTRDPGKALQWQNKADQIINGKSKNKKRGFDYDAYDPYDSTKQEYDKVDKQAVEDGIAKTLSRGKVNAISSTDAANIKSSLNNAFLAAGKAGVSVMDDDPNAPAGSEKDPKYHGVINGPSFTNFVLNTPNDGTFTEDKARSIIGNIKAALHLPDDRTPMITNIDGKLVVQIPKEKGKRDVVTFGDMLDTKEWKEARNGVKDPATGKWIKKPMNMPIIVGQDSLGRAIVRDLSSLKHLLIAGQTGMGKSVGLNTVISSLTLARDAGELDLDFIDMKGGMAMGGASRLPHSRGNVAKTGDEAMQRVVDFKRRMDEQAELLGGGYDGKQYSSIWEFNDAHPEHRLKPAVLIIDEAADLVSSDKNVLDPLARIAQEGRAPGFSLILATQRPDAKTIPSEISGQMPGKMIFKTKNATESRLLTDDYTSDGANLLGEGDMLFNDGKGFTRAQGAFIDDSAENNELEKVYSGIGNGHKKKNGGVQPKPTRPKGGGSLSPATNVASEQADKPMTTTNSSSDTAIGDEESALAESFINGDPGSKKDLEDVEYRKRVLPNFKKIKDVPAGTIVETRGSDLRTYVKMPDGKWREKAKNGENQDSVRETYIQHLSGLMSDDSEVIPPHSSSDTSEKQASTATNSASPVKLSDQDFQSLGIKKNRSKGDKYKGLDGKEQTSMSDDYRLPNGSLLFDYGDGRYSTYSFKQNKLIRMNADQVKKFVASGVEDPADFDLNS